MAVWQTRMTGLKIQRRTITVQALGALLECLDAIENCCESGEPESTPGSVSGSTGSSGGCDDAFGLPVGLLNNAIIPAAGGAGPIPSALFKFTVGLGSDYLLSLPGITGESGSSNPYAEWAVVTCGVDDDAAIWNPVNNSGSTEIGSVPLTAILLRFVSRSATPEFIQLITLASHTY